MTAFCGVLVACTLTACSSDPVSKTDVKIPTFAPGPSAPPITTTTTTEPVPEQPIVIPPPVTTTTPKTTKKPPPPKTTQPQDPTFTTQPIPPPPADDNVREGQKCSPDGSLAWSRKGRRLLICQHGVWTRMGGGR